MKNIMVNIVAIALLLMVVASVLLFGIFLYTRSLFFFGLTYTTMGHVMVYLVLSTAIGLILELFFMNGIRVFYDFKFLDRKQFVFFSFTADCLITLFSLSLIDYLMSDVTVPVLTKCLFAVFVSLIFVALTESKGKPDAWSPELEQETTQLLSEHTMVETIKLVQKSHPTLSRTQAKKLVQYVKHKTQTSGSV